jgi:type I restriction enzyme M protein
MAIKKSDIYRSLWDSCDQLRGGMDASFYKDYILALLFVKYVSNRAGQPDAFIKVPEGCSFGDICKLRGTKDICEGIDTAIAGIAEANDLKNVIDRAYFNDTEKFGPSAKMVTSQRIRRTSMCLLRGEHQSTGNSATAAASRLCSPVR